MDLISPDAPSDATILVVDDDWMNREVIEAYLTSAGFGVVTAHSGEDALAMIAAAPPDLIMLDVRMSGMDGYEVCQRLKGDAATRHIPVVMVTALEADEDKRAAIEAGADDFVSKPFDALLMLTRVRSLLRIKYLYDAIAARDQALGFLTGLTPQALASLTSPVPMPPPTDAPVPALLLALTPADRRSTAGGDIRQASRALLIAWQAVIAAGACPAGDDDFPLVVVWPGADSALADEQIIAALRAAHDLARQTGREFALALHLGTVEFGAGVAGDVGRDAAALAEKAAGGTVLLTGVAYERLAPFIVAAPHADLPGVYVLNEVR